jgi:hypothetical protein
LLRTRGRGKEVEPFPNNRSIQQGIMKKRNVLFKVTHLDRSHQNPDVNPKSLALHMGHIDYVYSYAFFPSLVLLQLMYWLQVISRCVGLQIMNIDICNPCLSVTMHANPTIQSASFQQSTM